LFCQPTGEGGNPPPLVVGHTPLSAAQSYLAVIRTDFGNYGSVSHGRNCPAVDSRRVDAAVAADINECFEIDQSIPRTDGRLILIMCRVFSLPFFLSVRRNSARADD